LTVLPVPMYPPITFAMFTGLQTLTLTSSRHSDYYFDLVTGEPPNGLHTVTYGPGYVNKCVLEVTYRLPDAHFKSKGVQMILLAILRIWSHHRL
jgi:hypothetical protein